VKIINSTVKYYLNSLNYTETEIIFGCSRQSLMRWVKQFEKNKNIKHRLKRNKQITINRLHQKLIKKF